MKAQILKAIKDTQSKTREVGIHDSGYACLKCGNKRIDMQPYLTDGALVLQVILDSTTGNHHFLRDLIITPETMVNLALIFNKYISQAFEPSGDVSDD